MGVGAELMISYKAGYKYQLTKTYQVTVFIYPAKPVETKYLSLSTDGLLTIRDGYAWDGPSGPTIDSKNFIITSLPHDAIYQLIRMDLLGRSCKELADRLLRRMFVSTWIEAHPKPTSWFKRGVYNTRLTTVKVRAWYVWRAVQWFGKDAAFGREKPVLTAP